VTGAVAVLILLGIAVRVALWVAKVMADSKSDHGGSGPAAPGDPALVAWLVAVLGTAGATLAFGGPVMFVVVVPATLIALEPSALAPLLVPRLGPVAAYWTARLSLVVWRRDRRGGAAAMAAQATIASGATPPPVAVHGPVTTGVVLAAGLGAACGDDLVGARALVQAAGWFDAQPQPLVVLRQEWIAADLAARGRWELLAAHTPDTSPRLLLLRAVAERLLDVEDAADAAALEHLARPLAQDPRWRPILDRARGARHRATFQAPPLPEDDFVRALEVHRRALLDDSWLDAAVDAWDDVTVPEAIRDRVLRDLGDGYLTAGRVPDAGAGAVRAALADRLHGAALDDLTAQGKALAARLAARRDLDPLAELREFAWFVHHFPVADEVPEGTDAFRRRALFRAVYGPLSDWSADLYNRRHQPYLFRAVTRWLLAQAHLVADAHSESVLRRNLEISASFG
jgi:hypothetical protein